MAVIAVIAVACLLAKRRLMVRRLPVTRMYVKR